MAELLNDNFETGDFSKWTSLGDYEEVLIASGISGMQGTYCAHFPDSSGAELIKELAVSKAEIFGAMDFKAINASGGYGNIMAFMAGANTLGMLYADSPGTTPIKFQLCVYSGYYEEELARHAVDLDAGVVYRIQVRYIPHATAGVFQVKLDGVLVIDYAGPTAPSTTNVDTVRLGMSQAEGWDSMYFYADQVVLDDAAWPDAAGPALQTLEPSSIASGEAFGTAVVKFITTVSPVGIASGQAFGTPGVTTGPVTVAPVGIPSAGAVGTLIVIQIGRITPLGIVSAEAFGTPTIQPGPVTVAPVGIPSGEALGSPQVKLINHYAADGFIALCGEGTSGGDENATTTEYIADGCIQIVGEGVVDSPELTTAFVASGTYILGGTGIVDSRIPAAYQATGHIELSGTCQLTSPDVPPILMISQYEAGGSLALLGSCSLESVLLQVDAFMAAGCYSLSGRSALSVIMPSLRVDAYVAAGCYELHGPCSTVRGPVYAYAADTKTGPCLEITSRARVGFIFPQITAMAAQGGYVLESPDVPDDGVFETLVLTGARSEVSVYSNFKFNSYAKYGGKYYGATQDGIFLLEGDDDAGIQIHTGAKIGPTNFGTDREKRLRLIRCGGDCDLAQVRVSDGNGKSGQFPVRGGRADISRAVQGRELTVEIVDFKSLNHLEIIPLVLAKR